jgi:O-Antigen ligase
MLAIVICLAALVGCYVAGRRSLWGGLMATMVVGYFYGIMRANIESRFSHFFFDFAAVGFYLALITRQDTPIQRFKMRRLMPWVLALAGWPMLLMLIPQQSVMVQLVGLRGQIFFVPFLLVGAMLDGSEMRKIAGGLAILSLIELGFALAEVQFGLQRFYPFNEVDQLIYNSMDVAVGSTNAFRIPATFVQAAAYGGNMVTGLPLLLGAMIQEQRGGLRRRLLLVGLGASALGVFLSASRSQATMLFILGLAATFSGRIKNFPWFGWIGLLAVVATLVIVSPRMQRFVTLQDTTYLKKRVSGSMNSNFADLALKYPLGNGLGGGGTSLPYFLQAQLRHPVAIENEYGRIMLEQGVPGLALWLAFIFWVFTRPLPRDSDPWYLGKWLARVALFFCFATAPTGLGLLTSIPGTALILVFAGWIASPNVTAGGTRAARRTAPARPMNPALKTA